MTATGCFSAVTLGQIAVRLGVNADPTIYGKLIFLFSTIGYLGAIPCFWRAGKYYKEFMDNKDKENNKLVAA